MPQKLRESDRQEKKTVSAVASMLAAKESAHTHRQMELDLDPAIPCKASDVFVALNDNGTLVEGGEVYCVSNTDVSVGVTVVVGNWTASGSLVVGSTLMEDVSITTPINKLRGVVSTLSSRDTTGLKKHSLYAKRGKKFLYHFL